MQVMPLPHAGDIDKEEKKEAKASVMETVYAHASADTDAIADLEMKLDYDASEDEQYRGAAEVEAVPVTVVIAGTLEYRSPDSQIPTGVELKPELGFSKEGSVQAVRSSAKHKNNVKKGKLATRHTWLEGEIL